MKKAFLLSLLTFLLFSCDMKNNESQAQVKASTWEVGEFETIDSSYLAFPLTLGNGGDSYNLKDIVSRSDGGASLINILFYNLKTKESHLLVENKRIYILGYETLKSDISKSLNTYKLYRVIDQDYTKDKKWTYEDGYSLYLSSPYGEDFHKISPPNEAVISWRLVNKDQTIILRTKEDSNKNSKFDEEDSIKMYRLDYNNLFLPENIITDKIQKQINQILELHTL